MKSIAIVGAGQSGLQLGLALLQHGYEVTLISNRTADQIRAGKVMSSQCMFDTALQIERDLGLNGWEADTPQIEGFGIAIADPDAPRRKQIHFVAPLDRYAQSVDQRVKMPAWMDEFERRGGRLVICDAGIEDLEAYAAAYDLVIVAAGKGEIVKLFERDAERSQFDRPQRALALTYVRGVVPRSPLPGISFNARPGLGELVIFPALTVSGQCEIVSFFGIPGGPMDCWSDVVTPDQHLEKTRWLLDTFFPWEADRCRNIELTDPNGILSGRFAPTVRKPLARLPSGRVVLGMADAVVVNDPITGQGSNNAAKCATSYLKSILELGERAPTQEWMTQTFERFWAYAHDVSAWTNAMLLPPESHVLNLLGAAGKVPDIARTIVNGFDDPRKLYRLWMDPLACERYVGSHTGSLEVTA
ncbi:styrene monooxygenase/indole monooxygenase family protein [Aromatoleum bremense]|uniref:FAD-binding oxidoreductase n=1 Tax=Aromatoleum bremense TaxID=76115 RepID=A0ABX1NV38_9RHOO|nr:styrene monooxygenase/indole monooxygenase family protein [Aromatoleum bremense]NMG15773.1 FAD-binding oxidoreductase [Aromatoleum bremense]QTQ30020.1 FAD/NAD(P)-binding domain-containing protein [Aromatoleum bremense]